MFCYGQTAKKWRQNYYKLNLKSDLHQCVLINDVEELTTVFSYDKIEETIKNRQFSKIKVGNFTAHFHENSKITRARQIRSSIRSI